MAICNSSKGKKKYCQTADKIFILIAFNKRKHIAQILQGSLAFFAM